jgi:putative peptide zinc metalloprotease protein
MIQLSKLLYVVASQADGRRGFREMAEGATQDLGRGVSADNVSFLVEKKLRPLGVLAAADGSSPQLKRNDPMLALKFRAALVPEGVVNVITTVLKPLFFPPVVVAVLLALIGVDLYVFAFHGVAQSIRDLLYQPAFFLLVLGLVILSAAFHECGHATACRYGGARPGVMGAGLYIVWPAFYTDVTDAYRLSKGGRLRTDLGGVYFNVIFTLATAAAYFVTRFEPLIVIVLIQHVEILHQFLPSLRLDGYYVVSDLTGVPDLFSRMKPTLKSLVPGRTPDKKVTELKPRVRVAVTIWVLLTIPIVLYLYGVMLVNAPRIIATAWDSLGKQAGMISSATQKGDGVAIAVGAIQVVTLVLPIGGMILSLVQTARRVAVAGWNRTKGKPLLRGGFVLLSALAVALLVAAWLPHGNNYRPIQPGDRGTVQGGIASVEQAPAAVRGNPPPQTYNTEVNQPQPLPSNPIVNETPTPGAGSSPQPSSSPKPLTSPTP